MKRTIKKCRWSVSIAGLRISTRKDIDKRKNLNNIDLKAEAVKDRQA